MMSHSAGKKIVKIAIPIVSILLLIVFLFPVVWMFVTSFKPTSDIFKIPSEWVFTPTLDHYRLYFVQGQILDRYKNTIIIAVFSSLVSVIAGSMAGYALSRLKIRGAAWIGTLILASRAIPPIALVVPMFLMFRRLGLTDKHITLILAYTTFLIPYVVWLMRSFFLSVPTALEDAALVDGCSRISAFFRVILPNTLPGLTATLIFCIILAWNELLFALILTSRNATTIPVVIAGLYADSEQGALWGPILALGSMTVLPVIFFAMSVQKYLIRGLAAGSTSGSSN